MRLHCSTGTSLDASHEVLIRATFVKAVTACSWTLPCRQMLMLCCSIAMDAYHGLDATPHRLRC